MSKRVLVVEDDILNSAFLCTTLESHGFAVHSVSDGAYAIAAARAFRPDLITMDIDLPHVSGLELIHQLKSDPELGGIPVLTITAHVGRIEELQIRRAGASRYMAKPVTMRGLFAAVDELLGGSGGAVSHPGSRGEARAANSRLAGQLPGLTAPPAPPKTALSAG
ncbi:MAG: hypothetical protein B7Z08_04115 [Sphingomonadales bacterium 32-68-7]|nr:MAG: hypothetical protein B7Z33_13700 [Sphingomonadales bacterium 12-68-11]OYX09719.1 MAG: hypothetical protein B7Z08_04115 [Sphingomonadales bacterium 32-68-7]